MPLPCQTSEQMRPFLFWATDWALRAFRVGQKVRGVPLIRAECRERKLCFDYFNHFCRGKSCAAIPRPLCLTTPAIVQRALIFCVCLLSLTLCCKRNAIGRRRTVAMIIFRGFRGIKTEPKKIRSDSKEVSLQFIPIFQDTPNTTLDYISREHR